MMMKLNYFFYVIIVICLSTAAFAESVEQQAPADSVLSADSLLSANNDTTAETTYFGVESPADTSWRNSFGGGIVSSTIKMVLALLVTIGLLVAVMLFLKKVTRMRMGEEGASGIIKIIDIRHLDPKRAVFLIRVLDRVLIVGSAEGSLTTLGELSDEDVIQLDTARNHPNSTSGFSNIFTKFMENNKKKGGGGNDAADTTTTNTP
jgi:flagellar biogenesis protein FliO